MSDTRTDLREFLVATVTGSANFRTLTGWTAQDPRCYWYYQGDTESISDSKPAFVTWSETGESEAPDAVESMIFSVMIWSREYEIARTLQIRDVIVGLLHKKPLTTGTGRKLYAKKIHETDYFMVEPQYEEETWMAVGMGFFGGCAYHHFTEGRACAGLPDQTD